MSPRSTQLLISATAGLLAFLLPLWVLVLVAQIKEPIPVFIVAGLAVLSTILFPRWLGKRLDAIWLGESHTPIGGILLNLGERSAGWTAVAGAVGFVASIIWYPLATQEDNTVLPIQPVTTLILVGLWLTFVLVSLAKLLSTQRDDPAALARFCRNAVIGAIVLSVIFVLPFDRFASLFWRAWDIEILGKTVARTTRLSVQVAPEIVWLQSTAIPSIFAIGFGFLTAYISSLVWYEFYTAVAGAGLKIVNASRRGRDPSRNERWFEPLERAKARILFAGATLGGWFLPWERLRAALHQALERPSVKSIVLILPLPGSAFFWQRRGAEIGGKSFEGSDPIGRLSNTIEMLYVILPDSDDLSPRDFLAQHEMDYDPGDLRRFEEQFRSSLAGKVALELNTALSDSIKRNVSVSANNTSLQQAGKTGKLRVVFTRDSLMGLNVIDDEISYSPYLPGLEDKDCPEFVVGRQTLLGSSLEKSAAALEENGISVTSKSAMIALAFLLKRECSRRHVDVLSMSNVPRWLAS
ncbi:MAG: hypothetical protein QOF41_2917 [Methylobacteriaceae bacterium]|nr:hypothetical protein [Methylobacteriaceae bacterium]